VEKLALPTITLLSPVVAIGLASGRDFRVRHRQRAGHLHGSGRAVLPHGAATVSQIDGVNRNLINVARHHGSSKWQIYTRVTCRRSAGPADGSPYHMFGAWMVVLVAESTGVDMALAGDHAGAHTFNPRWCSSPSRSSAARFLLRWLMRLLQRKILYWVPETTGVLRGL